MIYCAADAWLAEFLPLRFRGKKCVCVRMCVWEISGMRVLSPFRRNPVQAPWAARTVRGPPSLPLPWPRAWCWSLWWRHLPATQNRNAVRVITRGHCLVFWGFFLTPSAARVKEEKCKSLHFTVFNPECTLKALLPNIGHDRSSSSHGLSRSSTATLERLNCFLNDSFHFIPRKQITNISALCTLHAYLRVCSNSASFMTFGVTTVFFPFCPVFLPTVVMWLDSDLSFWTDRDGVEWRYVLATGSIKCLARESRLFSTHFLSNIPRLCWYQCLNKLNKINK